MSKNLKSRSNKLHANYDYENFYDKETGEINQQFLQDVIMIKRQVRLTNSFCKM